MALCSCFIPKICKNPLYLNLTWHTAKMATMATESWKVNEAWNMESQRRRRRRVPGLDDDVDDDDKVQKIFGASAVGRSYSALAIRKTTRRQKINCPGPRVSWKFFLPHFWGSKGAFDAILDALGTPLERFWNHLGRSWDALGAILGALGRVLGALGTLLGALRAILGRPWAKRSVRSLFGRPSWEVKWDQNY